jgi:ankyrin repeat protein
VKVVELLSVEKFADVINKASDSDGATPLMRCCESGALDCAELLVERGADINAENIRNGALSLRLRPSPCGSCCSK